MQEIDGKVFWPSMIITLAVAIPSIIYGEQLRVVIDDLFNKLVLNLNWIYIWYPIIFTVFCLFLSFSKYGKIVLGDPKDKAQFTFFQYSAILVAMYFGSTLLRTGVISWAAIALDPPFGMASLSGEAMIAGASSTMFIWGMPLSAIYCGIAPGIAYMLHVRKNPSIKISELLRVVLGDRFSDGIGGKLVDIMFLFSMILSSATFIGLATPVLSAIVSRLSGVPVSFTMDIVLTLLVVLIFSASAYLGIEKGIRRLSEFNIYLGAVLAVIITISIPGGFVIGFLTDSLGSLFNNYMNFAFYGNSIGSLDGTVDTTQSFMVFWWSYVATTSLIHGIFLAMISKGRTIKELILTCFVAPQLVAALGVGILSATGVWSYTTGRLPLFDILAASGEAVAVSEVLKVLPLSFVISILFIFLFITFLATTMDSTAYTIAAYASKGDMISKDPSKGMTLVWSFILSGMALIMMKTGGLSTLSVLNGIMGVPVIFFQLFIIWGTMRMINQDEAWIHNVRAKNLQ